MSLSFYIPIEIKKAIRIVFFVFVVASAGCIDRGDTQGAQFNAQRAYQDVEAQMAFGPRMPGSIGHERTGAWIEESLQEAGWSVEYQDFEYESVAIRNLIANQNNDPGAPWVLLGTHYDTRPVADKDPVQPDQPVPGANDGASGVAVLLELARIIPQLDIEYRTQLAFFDAEDSGGLDGWKWIVGSSYYAEQLTDPPEFVIIIDMVGDANLEIFYDRNSDPGISEAIWTVAAQLGYQDQFIPKVKYSMLDDHTPFVTRGIPAVDIIDFDYPYWHTTEDTIDKVSPESLAVVGETVLQFLLDSLN